jgi:adenylate cyclase
MIPLGGGDDIPLLKKTLLVGRRESCDIVLRFANVSAHHCLLYVNGGYWYVKDQESRNGTKVNGILVTEKRINAGDSLSIAKHEYRFEYSPRELGAVGPPPPDELPSDVFDRSLMQRAGLDLREKKEQDREARRAARAKRGQLPPATDAIGDRTAVPHDEASSPGDD